MGEGDRGQHSRLSVVVRETLSEEGTIWGLYNVHTLGVDYQLFEDCTHCSVRGVWTSTIWGFYTGLLGDCTGCQAHHWLGVKKNILAERRGNLLGNICKEYDITATKHII